jgi:alpha-L-glutamate ligase-like protein
MKLSYILGLNARSQEYLKYNSGKSRRIADSKLLSARMLTKAGIPTPEVFAKFKNPSDIFKFNGEKLPEACAVKPNRGYGGEGIIVVKKKDREGRGWITTQKKIVTAEDLKLQVLDVLEGAFSLGNIPDTAFIQEYVGRHKAFRKFAYRGTPDIRIIVFNKIPVMAMLRLPTKDSGGRANLHQGALGVGIDIATGITTKAIWYGEQVTYKPGTSRKLHGIKIPNWTTVLETAVAGQIASGLGYGGVDIVLHPEKGPMILELNARPGLQIQLANMAGLRKRLERVEELEVRDAEHGVKIAKALFAERFADRVAMEEGIKTLGTWEKIKIVDGKGHKHEVVAKVDTGAWRTSIDKDLAHEFGLDSENNILWSKSVRSGLGKENRLTVNLTYYLAGRRVKTIAGLANRSNLRTPIIIGRRDLEGYVVNPRKGYDNIKDALPSMWKKLV